MIISNFVFNPIGQGSFYTGEIDFISRHHNRFSFVYDCGTLSERTDLSRCIDSYKRKLDRRNLNVLFISHLDDDHVNGISELLNGIVCENIYLPYLTPFQRLYVAIRHSAREVNDLDDFLTFIKSPHDYILNIEGSDVKKIIYIKGNSEDDFDVNENNNKPVDIDDTKLEFKDNLELVKLEDDNPEIAKILASPKSKKIEFKYANNTLVLNRIWEFYIYHEPADETKVNELITLIKKLYGFDINENLTQPQLISILDNKGNLKKLRDEFRTLFKSLNKTCLLVQHKPIGYKSAELYKEVNFTTLYHYFNRINKQLNSRLYRSKTNPLPYKWGVTLLTGDIGLDQIEDSTYIEDHLSSVLVFQVPHHGSETGWDDDYLASLNYQGKTSAVINFGYGNKHGHPKPVVLKELDIANFDIRFCNQFEYFEYHITLKF